VPHDSCRHRRRRVRFSTHIGQFGETLPSIATLAESPQRRRRRPASCMNFLGHRLVTWVLAFLVLASAAGASILEAHPTSSCRDPVSRASLGTPPCHEERASQALSCADGGRAVSQEGSVCGNRCSHCAGHQTSSPVGAMMSGPPGLVVGPPLEPTPLLRPAAQGARPEANGSTTVRTRPVLDRRAWHRTERAEHAAVARLRPEHRLASGALVEVDARVGGHSLRGPSPAGGTSQSRFEDDGWVGHESARELRDGGSATSTAVRK
jgi:hypothetical protein